MSDKSEKAHVCAGLLLLAGSMEADLKTVALFLPEPEPVINGLNPVPLKDENVNKKRKNKNTGRRSLIWTEGQDETAGTALILDLSVHVCVCVYLAGIGLAGCCRLGVILGNRLHVGAVIPICRHRWRLKHKITVSHINIRLLAIFHHMC